MGQVSFFQQSIAELASGINESVTRELNVRDADPDALGAMLEFAYTASTPCLAANPQKPPNLLGFFFASEQKEKDRKLKCADKVDI